MLRGAKAILLLVAVFACRETRAAEDAKAEPFPDVIQKHFEQWAKGNTLTADEVVRLIRNRPNLHRNAAAALVAIHEYQQDHKNCAVTKDLLLRPPRSGKNVGELENNYQRAHKRIATAPRELFIGQAPTLTSIHQGERGDCFFLAPVGAALNRDPKRVRRMFEIHEDGSFEIIFTEQHKEHFNRLTDAQIGLNDDYDSRTEGLWLTALEVGMGRRFREAGHQPNGRGKPKAMTATDRIANGGDAAKVMAQLTGHHIVDVEIKPTNAGKIRDVAKGAHAHLVCLGCDRFAGRPTPGMSDEHEYAILGYDSKSDSLHLWNPWGNNHKPKGTPGLTNGYVTESGHFHLPLRDLVNGLKGEISYETNKPQTADDGLGK